MNRRDFFNAMADTWDTRCRHDQDRVNEILDLLPLRMGDEVLDVGAGTGVLIPFLLERIGDRGTITAIDMSEKMIRIAERKFEYKNVRFMADDVFSANLQPPRFDVILCYSVFPHFDDKKVAVAKLSRRLNPGGILAICHSEGRDDINSLHKNISPAVAHDHLPPAEEIAEYLAAAGCEIVTLLDTERLFVVAGRKSQSGENPN
ncbi:MAG: class I SAM-dependent methyltransferase [Geobacteraceae bacterium]|nr:class I SAM-dependent methyltransferase [Geobacteraceae bacterium]